jgi:hypothetical protein
MADVVVIRKRPLRVTIIGIISILAGLIFLFPVLGSFGLGDLVTMTGQTFQVGPLVLTAFVIAVANLVLGVGCLLGWGPIWVYLVIISVINFVFSVVALLNAIVNQLSVLIPIFWFLMATYVLFTVQSRKTEIWFHH